MALKRKERIGLYILVGLFSVFGLLLYFTVDRPTGPGRSIENNIIVEMRVKNLKSKQ